MTANKKFYITTPIYYVNDRPHIGHTYTTVAADVLARYHRLLGEEVFLLTGTDENSQKNVAAAAKAGESDIGKYLDEMSGVWRQTWSELGLTFDGFIRTTEPRHIAAVNKFWEAVKTNQPDDIYRGEYSGFYCEGCEAFVTETDLIDGDCPIHKKPPKQIREKNWFFRLSSYRQRLLDHIDSHPDFIRPESRRNEVRSYVDKFMADISISRESVKWGIPVPGDPKSVIYVWFDALINYLSGIGYGTDDARFANFWPSQVHLVGKDIIKFHCALWPAMLMAAGLPLPEQVFAHGFFTINGDKISKSLGNAIDPRELVKKFGFDPIRYFLLREINFGQDGDFSFERLSGRYQNDLGNELGNLLHRVLSMTEKYFDGLVPADGGGCAEAPIDQAKDWADYEAALSQADFGAALEVIWVGLRWDNKHIDETKPWALAKTDRPALAKTIYYLLEHLRQTAWMLRPFMPDVSARMLEQLGAAAADAKKSWSEAKVWGGLPEGAKIAKGEPLFPRIESENKA
ncbi:MAG: methionine--tRNA ligase [Patescibacteria group bacterium]